MIENEMEINRNLECSWKKRGFLNRIYYRTIFRLAYRRSSFPKSESKARILDLGCGDGTVSRLLHDQGICNIVAFDYNPYVLKFGHPFDIVIGRIPEDMNALRGKGPFDYVLILGVLHHIETEKIHDVFASLSHMMPSTGKVILWEPADNITLRAMYFLIRMNFLMIIDWFKRARGSLLSEEKIINDFIEFFYDAKKGRNHVRKEVISPFVVEYSSTCWHGMTYVMVQPQMEPPSRK